MRVLVTGANGQLGHDLTKVLSSQQGLEVVGCDRQQLDVGDLERVRSEVQRVSPDVVIHTAAYTAVDQAETNVDDAFRTNADGSRNVALAAEEASAKVCYISTDYVFDGALYRPYREFDRPGPMSVYGQSKLAGEVLTQTLCSRYFIVRTAWVYGAHGDNFVQTMLRLANERDQLQVVDDQHGSPTYTVDLARFIADLVATDKYGVYHATNTGSCSWYDFARAIFEESGIVVTVDPCSTEAFPRPAQRPRNSVLDHVAIRTNGFTDLPPWRDGLQRFLAEIGVRS